MKKTEPAVLIFGLDGATWKIINPLLRKGKLPFLKKVIKNGVKGILKSSFPSLTSTAWVSFQTGAFSSRHGILGFLKENGRVFTSQDVKLPRFWEIAGKAKKSSAIINMPLTYPPQPLRGVLVTSFLTPPNSSFTYPPELQKELIKINYQTNINFESHFFFKNGKLSSSEKKNITKEISQLIERRQKTALHILKKRKWDIFFILFKNTDLAQHLFWKGKETVSVYQQIDRAMARIFRTFQRKISPRKINTIIISDHGFHPVAKKDICLYPLFRRLKIIPSPFPFYLKVLRGLRKITKSKKIERFCFANSLKITDFGAFFKKIEKKEITLLRKKLLSFRIGKRKVFSEVKISQTKLKNFPQLLWITNPYFAPNADPLSEKLTYPRQSHFKGRHHSDRKGIFIVSGPNVRKVPSKKIFLNIADIPVNILRLLGISPPCKVDGKANSQVFIFPKEKNFSMAGKTGSLKNSFLNKEDEEAITKRLKALGYI